MKLSLKRKRRARVASPDDRMTLTEHLAELRSRIIRSLLAMVMGIIIVLAAYGPVLRFLTKPYVKLCARKGSDFCVANLFYLSPLEGFTTRLSIATYGGIILALPVIMWQVWRFIVPALHAKEKKYAIPFVASSVALFALG
ncbi:MAG: sec-independent protein translocase protein TatC, partial [Ilumatobacteraceae bacterium]